MGMLVGELVDKEDVGGGEGSRAVNRKEWNHLKLRSLASGFKGQPSLWPLATSEESKEGRWIL